VGGAKETGKSGLRGFLCCTRVKMVVVESVSAGPPRPSSVIFMANTVAYMQQNPSTMQNGEDRPPGSNTSTIDANHGCNVNVLASS